MNGSGKSQALRWVWMMEYCLKNKLPAGEQTTWDAATRAYERYMTKSGIRDWKEPSVTVVFIDECGEIV